MEQLIEGIVQSVRPDQRTLIAISGHGAAGKSTLAEKLRERLGDINLLHTDPYITDSQLRKQTILTYQHDGMTHQYKMTACHPAAHHLLSLERDVRMIREGIGFYTIDVSYLERTWIDPEKMITIIEGMSVGTASNQTIPHAHLHVIPRYEAGPHAGKGLRHWLKRTE